MVPNEFEKVECLHSISVDGQRHSPIIRTDFGFQNNKDSPHCSGKKKLEKLENDKKHGDIGKILKLINQKFHCAKMSKKMREKA